MFDYAEDDSLWKEDLFAILGVAEADDERALKDAYRKLTKQYHPDRFPAGTEAQKEAKERFSKITKAYDVLTHEIKRQSYLDTRRLLSEHLNKQETSSAPKTDKPSQSVDDIKRKQAEDLYNQAEKCFKKTALEQAADFYKQAIELCPQVAKFHSHLGKAYLDRGWKGMAQSEFKIALNLNPRDPVAQEGYETESVKKEKKSAGAKTSFFRGLFARFKKK